MKRSVPFLLAALLCLPALCRAEGDNQLTRDESAAFKKKLVAVLGALGQAPEGFTKGKDEFDLPTEWAKDSSGKLNPVSASAERKLAIKGVKEAESGTRQLGTDYQKKFLAAQSKGDYQEMMRLSQEMQKQTGEAALKGVEAQDEKKLPIEVRVNLNSSEYEAIDPDLVVFEKPGVIALKKQEGEEGDPKGNISIYFDPVSLKDTKKLSKVEIKWGSVPSKTCVFSVAVRVEGPIAEIEAWVKKIDTKTILAQIDCAAKP